MKREMVCKKCFNVIKTYLSSEEMKLKVEIEYPDEKMKIVKGKAKINMICNYCRLAITIDEKCMAVSYFRPMIKHDYFSWEDQVLKELENE